MTKDYFILNNMLNVPVEGQIPLHYDREALEEYLNTEIRGNLKTFDSIDEKLDYLISHDYIDESVLSIYGKDNRIFIKELFKFAYNYGFKFKSFMAAYKFYNQYAMKTNDSKYYLENFEDRAVFNALYLANGDRNLAHKILEELISQRYQPATPTFLNAGKKRRGEMVLCFLIDIEDSMLSIGRNINSALQLSRMGGGGRG